MAVPRPAIVFVFGAQLTMYAYDWLLSVAEEVEIVSARGGLTWSLAIYFVARYVLLSFPVASPVLTAHSASELMRSLLLVMFTNAQLDTCQPISSMLSIAVLLSIASTSLLFFLRVRAVYMKSTRITVFFGFLWLATVAIAILNDFYMRAAHRPGTRICTSEDPAKYTTMPVYATFCNDSMVFLAITYRLTADAAVGDDWRSRLLSVVRGRGLHQLSKSLLQSGQLYYFATILFFLANLAVLDSPLITAAPDHVILVNMYTAFTNMVACLVLRNVVLGIIQKERILTGLSSTAIAAAFQMEPLVSGRRHSKHSC
ncbi:hypothetical protein HWV62_33621 [Athelia sp. TMB]|nr:hypothetical protein HWV62_33621 [Athelia sp. TMB]